MKSSRLKSNLVDMTILAFAVITALLVIAYLISERNSDFSISSDEFLTYLQTHKPIVIDLREPNEISRMRLNYQPVNYYPFLNLEKDMSQLKIDTTLSYLLICNDGNRSRLVSTYLASQRIKIPYLQGGLWGVPKEQLDQLSQISD